MKNIKKSIIMLVAIVFTYTFAMAGDPIHGVDVKLGAIQNVSRQTPKRDFGEKMQSTTDNNGIAIFKDVPAGEYKVTIPMKTLQDYAIKEQGVKSYDVADGKKGLNAVNVKKAIYEVTIAGAGKNIRKNITVNLRTSAEKGITAMDDWEAPVVLKAPADNAQMRWTLEVRVDRIEMK